MGNSQGLTQVHRLFRSQLALLVSAVLAATPLLAEPWGVEQHQGELRIEFQDQTVAKYIYQDPEISRPYFTDLCAASGLRLTRNHPPVEEVDRMDHPEFHPGLWLAFGDLSGADSWRLKAAVVHEKFLQEPRAERDVLRFAVQNRYMDDAGDATICRETARYTWRQTEWGLLLTWDSTFRSDDPFWFGDQEEMGLGIRVASSLRVEREGPDPAVVGTGEMIDDQGRRNAAEIWGKEVRWLDYHGQIAGEPAGVTLFCHPKNFRATRMHARDYGFVAANPFSLAAFDAGEPSRTTVSEGESLRFRYGLLLHAGQELSADQLDSAYRNYSGIESP